MVKLKDNKTKHVKFSLLRCSNVSSHGVMFKLKKRNLINYIESDNYRLIHGLFHIALVISTRP